MQVRPLDIDIQNLFFVVESCWGSSTRHCGLAPAASAFDHPAEHSGQDAYFWPPIMYRFSLKGFQSFIYLPLRNPNRLSTFRKKNRRHDTPGYLSICERWEIRMFHIVALIPGDYVAMFVLGQRFGIVFCSVVHWEHKGVLVRYTH